MIDDILAMSDNDPIRFTARNLEETEFLIRLVVHEDILYFSYKIRQDQFFITGHVGYKEKLCCQTFLAEASSSTTKYALLFVRWEKFPTGSDGELTEQVLTCSDSTSCNDIDDENNQPVDVKVFGVVTSNGDFISPFIFSHGLRLQVPVGGSAALDQEGGC